MRTTFLLGSGISFDAGFPTVEQITDQVVTGDGVWRHTDGTYVIGGHSGAAVLHQPKVGPVLDLLADVRKRLSATLTGGEPTYEDLALVVRQVHDALSGEYESPAVLPFADQLATEAGVTDTDLRELCEETLRYIDDTVTQLLGRGRLDHHAHLAAILEACRIDQRVDLATLNHDLLLETALHAARIAYADGFEPSIEDVRLWRDEWQDATVRLLKLHGSTDWFDVRDVAEPVAPWNTGGLRRR